MPNGLAGAVSPYLRSHAGNPVDWYPWGEQAFAEAAARDVPVLVSIGYSTCHWCHVMARESFSDPDLAAYLNRNFVSIKVDREEHPDVDSSYLAAAGLFTPNLGWPLNVFVTPRGRAFFAGTYWPPEPMPQHPSFRQVLEAVVDAWTKRRDEVEGNASAVGAMLADRGAQSIGENVGELPDESAFVDAIRELADYEDKEFGGFGGAPKFPVAPVVLMLLERGSLGDAAALGLAERTLVAMSGSALRDPVEGGFFRYATRRDWAEPHYERMLYDNAQLLKAYALLGILVSERRSLAGDILDGLVSFLTTVLRVPGGAFASAQDSESTVDGHRVEGGYYALDATGRAGQIPPALDEKVLTGWNGLAIEALAFAGFARDRADWLAAARVAADQLIAAHLRPDGSLVRASVGGVASEARATLEDYGMFAGGLLQLALATGEARYAVIARSLVDASLSVPGSPRNGSPGGSADSSTWSPFQVPGGADPVLESHGLALEVDPSEGAYPSGLSAMAVAAHRLYLLTAHAPYLTASVRAMQSLSQYALRRPIAFGAALAVMSGLTSPPSQLIVVSDEEESPDGTDAERSAASVARRWHRSGGMAAVMSASAAAGFAAAGFELFAGRGTVSGVPTAYLCRDFTCLLPLTDAARLSAELAQTPG